MTFPANPAQLNLDFILPEVAEHPDIREMGFHQATKRFEESLVDAAMERNEHSVTHAAKDLLMSVELLKHTLTKIKLRKRDREERKQEEAINPPKRKKMSREERDRQIMIAVDRVEFLRKKLPMSIREALKREKEQA